ncbi:hypothetical protein pb186bvf_005191 [Paramecium bursaria]
MEHQTLLWHYRQITMIKKITKAIIRQLFFLEINQFSICRSYILEVHMSLISYLNYIKISYQKELMRKLQQIDCILQIIMIQFNYLQQLAYNVYIKRKELLLGTIDPQKLIRITMMDGFQRIKKAIEKMSEQDQERQLLSLYLIIHGTRCWQGYVLDKNGKQMFPKKDTSISYQQEIIGYMWMIDEYAQEDKINIEKFPDQDQLNRVKENLKKNIEIVKEAILFDKITFEDIDQYFKEIQILTIDGSLEESIYGLSSFDGKILYICKRAKNKKVEDKFIEALIVDHLYQWLIQNKDPFFTNNTFFLFLYMDFQVYKRKAWHFSPFSLLNVEYSQFLTFFL